MNSLSLIHVALILLGFIPAIILGLQIVFLFTSLLTCVTMIIADKVLA